MDLNPIDDILNGIGSIVGGAASAVGDAVLETVIKFLFGVVADAVTAVTNALIAAINDTTTIDLNGGWFASAEQRRLVGLVVGISAALILGFLLLTIVRSMIAGEPGQMIRAVLVDVPLAIFSSFAVLAVTGVLLAITDSASAAVLGDVGANLGQFRAVLGVADVLSGAGLLGLTFGLLFVAAAIVVWMQLLLRTALLYLVVTFAPLGFAARVYPGGRQVARRTVEIGVALIVSKFAIALAFAVGATALGGGTASRGAVSVDLRAMLVGTTIMLLAAFMPWLVWRTIPVFEAASVMQGAERAPLRAATTAASVALTAASVARLAGASGAAAKSTTTAGGASTSSSPSLASQQLLLEQLSAATRPRLDLPVDPGPANGSGAGKRDSP